MYLKCIFEIMFFLMELFNKYVQTFWKYKIFQQQNEFS